MTRRTEKKTPSQNACFIGETISRCNMNAPRFPGVSMFCFFFGGRFMHVMFLDEEKKISALFHHSSLLPLTIPPRQINCNAKIGKSKYRSELFHAAGAAAAVRRRVECKSIWKTLSIHNLYLLYSLILKYTAKCFDLSDLLEVISKDEEKRDMKRNKESTSVSTLFDFMLNNKEK